MDISEAVGHRIRVLCVDDHPIVLDGIATIVGRDPSMEVVAAAATGREGVELFKSHRPDVTLMDLRLGDISGVQAIRAIRREDPTARVIVLTVSQSEEDIHHALEAGATTYLLKDMLSADLVRVIAQVYEGVQPPLREVIKSRIVERAKRPELSYRELQILKLVAQGLRNREIAVALDISENTVQVHIRKILSKLDAKDRTAAVATAVRRGLIRISDA
jgi:two-component system NarL family response regulator